MGKTSCPRGGADDYWSFHFSSRAKLVADLAASVGRMRLLTARCQDAPKSATLEMPPGVELRVRRVNLAHRSERRRPGFHRRSRGFGEPRLISGRVARRFVRVAHRIVSPSRDSSGRREDSSVRHADRTHVTGRGTPVTRKRAPAPERQTLGTEGGTGAAWVRAEGSGNQSEATDFRPAATRRRSVAAIRRPDVTRDIRRSPRVGPWRSCVTRVATYPTRVRRGASICLRLVPLLTNRQPAPRSCATPRTTNDQAAQSSGRPVCCRLFGSAPSPTLTKPTHMTLHAPLRKLQLRPTIRARPNERLPAASRIKHRHLLHPTSARSHHGLHGP